MHWTDGVFEVWVIAKWRVSLPLAIKRRVKMFPSFCRIPHMCVGQCSFAYTSQWEVAWWGRPEPIRVGWKEPYCMGPDIKSEVNSMPPTPSSMARSLTTLYSIKNLTLDPVVQNIRISENLTDPVFKYLERVKYVVS